MKTLISLFIFIYSSTLFASDKILFIDANNNPGEIKVARETAKLQGKELVVYPSSKKEISVEDIADLIKKNQFSSVTFSGHSGGMLFYGEHGEILLKDLINQIKDHPNAKHIESLYLLGCNSGNKSKMMFWREAFPNIKFIAGFDGTAPLGSNQAGLNYYRDIMSKEDKIVQSANSNLMKKNLESVRGITAFPTSILVECQSNIDFLYQPQTRLGSQFEKFSMGNDCESVVSYFQVKYNDTIKEFINRNKNPRAETPAKLREIYEALRQKEHCEEEVKGQADANQFLFVRFMNEFDKNFFNYFNKSFNDLISSLKKFSENAPVNLDKYIEEKNKFYQKIKNDPAFKKQLLEENKSNIKKMITGMANSPDTKKCSEGLIQSLSHLNNASYVEKMETSCNSSSLTDYSTLKSMKNLYNSIYKDDETLMKKIEEVASSDLTLAQELKKDPSLKSTIDSTIRDLETLMKSPEKFDKKKLSDLGRNLYPIASLVGTEKAQVVADAIYTYRNLDPYIFPYSWYDKPHGQGIEPLIDPLLSKTDSDYVKKLDQSLMILRDRDGTFRRGSALRGLLSR